MVYYSVGVVVYGCTTPLIHGCKRIGCLLEKFFIFLFLESSKIAYVFSKNFFEIFFLSKFIYFPLNFFLNFFYFFSCERVQEYVYLQCMMIDFCFILLVVISSVFPSLL